VKTKQIKFFALYLTLVTGFLNLGADASSATGQALPSAEQPAEQYMQNPINQTSENKGWLDTISSWFPVWPSSSNSENSITKKKEQVPWRQILAEKRKPIEAMPESERQRLLENLERERKENIKKDIAARKKAAAERWREREERELARRQGQETFARWDEEKDYQEREKTRLESVEKYKKRRTAKKEKGLPPLAEERKTAAAAIAQARAQAVAIAEERRTAAEAAAVVAIAEEGRTAAEAKEYAKAAIAAAERARAEAVEISTRAQAEVAEIKVRIDAGVQTMEAEKTAGRTPQAVEAARAAIAERAQAEAAEARSDAAVAEAKRATAEAVAAVAVATIAGLAEAAVAAERVRTEARVHAGRAAAVVRRAPQARSGLNRSHRS